MVASSDNQAPVALKERIGFAQEFMHPDEAILRFQVACEHGKKCFDPDAAVSVFDHGFLYGII